MYIYRKRQLPFLCCKRNEKRKFIEGKNTTQILILVSTIEKHDSGQKHYSGHIFRPLVNYNFLKAQLQS